MAYLVRAFPLIRPVSELHAFLSALSGARRADTDTFYRYYDVSHESAYVQETRDGNLLIVVTVVKDHQEVAPRYKGGLCRVSCVVQVTDPVPHRRGSQRDATRTTHHRGILLGVGRELTASRSGQRWAAGPGGHRSLGGVDGVFSCCGGLASRSLMRTSSRRAWARACQR
jgi:hypothetical protein